MKMLKVWIIITTLIVLSFDVQAQSFGRSGPRSRGDIGYLSVGGSVGIMNYFGDLNPLAQYVTTDIRGTRPSIGINVQRKFSPRLIARVGLSWGRLSGDDFRAADPNDERHRYRYIRNAHFRNDIYELSFGITYDLFPSRFTYYRRANWTPYVTAGIAVFYHNPMAKTPVDLGNQWTYLRPLSTEGQGIVRSQNSPYPGGPAAGTSYGKPYSLIQPAVPVGVGVRFKLNDRWDLSAEICYRILFTDFIDDVSGNYANPSDLPGGANGLSAKMANRTNELIAARNGADRAPTRQALLQQLGYTNDRFAGFGNDGDKRGEPNNPDVYIFTGFHLTRIIGVGLRCPKFR
jgi:hypothetical protein